MLGWELQQLMKGTVTRRIPSFGPAHYLGHRHGHLHVRAGRIALQRNVRWIASEYDAFPVKLGQLKKERSNSL